MLFRSLRERKRSAGLGIQGGGFLTTHLAVPSLPALQRNDAESAETPGPPFANARVRPRERRLFGTLGIHPPESESMARSAAEQVSGDRASSPPEPAEKSSPHEAARAPSRQDWKSNYARALRWCGVAALAGWGTEHMLLAAGVDPSWFPKIGRAHV